MCRLPRCDRGIPLWARDLSAKPNPIQLHVDLDVDPSKEQEMVRIFRNIFRPTISKQPGFMEVKLLKLRETGSGARPKIMSYRLVISFDTEDLRKQWVATDDHQRIWPTIERTLTGKKVQPSPIRCSLTGLRAGCRGRWWDERPGGCPPDCSLRLLSDFRHYPSSCRSPGNRFTTNLRADCTSSVFRAISADLASLAEKRLEAPSGFEPLHKGFADLSLSHLGTAPQYHKAGIFLATFGDNFKGFPHRMIINQPGFASCPRRQQCRLGRLSRPDLDLATEPRRSLCVSVALWLKI